jgi:hypothetical protein
MTTPVAAVAPVDDFVVESNVTEPAAPAAEAQTPAPASQAGAGEATEGADGQKGAETGKPAEGAVDDAAASEAGRTLAARKKSAQQRIDEITWEREEARREVGRLRQELERRPSEAAKPADSSSASAVTMAPTRPKPALESFASADDPYSAWMESVAEWKAEQIIEQREAKRQAQTAVAAHVEREQAFAVAHPDYPTVVSTSSAPVSWAMGAAIHQSDRGPEIAYHLAQHPEVAAELARETAQSGPDTVGLVRRLLESRLDPAPSGSGSSAPKTSAKPPLRPVGSSPVVAHEGPPDDSASLDEHAQYYNRLDREARRR